MELFHYASGRYGPKGLQPAYHLYFASPDTGKELMELYLGSTFFNKRKDTAHLEEERTDKSALFNKQNASWVIGQLEALNWSPISKAPIMFGRFPNIAADRDPLKAQWSSTTVPDDYLAKLEDQLAAMSANAKQAFPSRTQLVGVLIGIVVVYAWLNS